MDIDTSTPAELPGDQGSAPPAKAVDADDSTPTGGDRADESSDAPGTCATTEAIGSLEPGDGTEPSAENRRLVQLVADLGKVFRAQLPQWQGRTLACFDWEYGSRKGTGAGGVEVVLQAVTLGKKANAVPRFTFRFVPRAGEPQDVPDVSYSLSAASAGTELVIFLNIESITYRQAVLLTSQDLANGVTGPLRARLATKGGRGREFGILWCSDERAHDELTKDWAIRRHRRVDAGGTLQGAWPTWAVDAEDSTEAYWLSVPDPSVPCEELAEDWCRCVVAYVLWSVLIGMFTGQEFRSRSGKAAGADAASAARPRVVYERLTRAKAGLPRNDYYYRAPRPVELSSSAMRARLERDGVRLPPQVLDAACAALNSGRNIILTGPPGNGKTELAVALAREWAKGNRAGEERREGLVATASPAWTTGDLIGRYFPSPTGTSLEFREGFLLRALRERRWLVIDEMNRAPIDSCFGELFTVLSGHSVDLPYQVVREGGKPPVPVRVLARGASASPVDDGGLSTSVDYLLFDGFRMIGTMNDADRNDLHRLSFAFLRRFDVIRIEAPAPDEVRRIIKDYLDECMSKARVKTLGYSFLADAKLRKADDLLAKDAQELLGRLFAPENGPAVPSAGAPAATVAVDLLQGGLIGVAIVKDIAKFIVEAMRASSSEAEGRDCVATSIDRARASVLSVVAMALVLKALPQLDAVATGDRRREVAWWLVEAFGKDAHLPFLRIVPRKNVAGEVEGEATKTRSDHGPAFELVEHAPPLGTADVDGNHVLSIAEYLVDECCRHFRDPDLERELRRRLLEACRAHGEKSAA